MSAKGINRPKTNFTLSKDTYKELREMQKATGLPLSRVVDLAVKKAKGKKLYV